MGSAPASAVSEAATITPDITATLKQLNITPGEYRKICNHLKRDPNLTELAMFSVLWSEHCCYKNSRHLLKKFGQTTQGAGGKRMVAGPGENAGVVDVGDGIQIAFKIESHNHPTAVEPYQGATTGVGGILRDIFTMNARPIANLNSLKFGPQTDTRNRYLFRSAVKGIGDYGNCVGVPTIAGEVFFDESYTGNPLVNAMSIGILYDGEMTSSKAQGIGNPVLYVGNATGRDGMGGAAFASKELDENSNTDRPAVQVGDPFSEKLLIEACLEAFATGCVVAAQDMGAAGLTSSSCEMADKGGLGMRMDLDKVPAREPDMKAVEYLLSESQERMLFILERGPNNQKIQPVLDVFKKWGLAAEIIGEVIGAKSDADAEGGSRALKTDDGQAYIEIYRHGKKEVDLPARLLTDLAPDYDRGVVPEEPEVAKTIRTRDAKDITDITWQDVPGYLEQLLASTNIASPKSVYRQYDRHVQNNTVLASENLSGGVIRLRQKNGEYSQKAITATTDCNPRHVFLEPYTGSMGAVAEAARNVVCTGTTPIAVTDNLNFGSPDKPEIYYQLYYAVEGIKDACLHFEIPVISGNVSLYNEHSGQPILPAPVIGLIGLTEQFSPETICSPSFKKAGDQIALIGRFKPALGGSEYQKLRTGEIYGQPPDVSLNDEKVLHQLVLNLIQHQHVQSVQDISLGGLLATLTECLFSNQLGAELQLEALSKNHRLDELLFGETHGSYLISYQPNQEDVIQKLIADKTSFIPLGTVTENFTLRMNQQTIDLKKLQTVWSTALE